MKILSIAWFFFATSASAAVLIHDQMTIDLTDAGSTPKLVVWGLSQQPLSGGRAEGLEVPDAKLLNITNTGLGWDGDALGSRDAWIHTRPITVAPAWRPPTRCRIWLKMSPGRSERTFKNGTTSQPYSGDCYVRFSADRKNWSSWQLMKSEESNGKQTAFGVDIGVPRVDRLEYDRMINDFQQQSVPWISDESAAARWIEKRDPKFFDEQIPFIGYIEILLETSISGGDRLKQIDISWSYAISGLHAPPSDPAAYKTGDEKWRFRRDDE